MQHVAPLFSRERIAARVEALAGEIAAASSGEEIFLLGILKGASVFLADLLRALGGDVSYGFVDVVREVADAQTAAALEIDFISYTDIRGRNVYLLKDVVSSGVIETYLLTQLRIHEPKSLHLVALLDRPALRTVDLTADFRVFDVDGRGTYAGYGLEHDGHFANLPYLGRVGD